MIIIKYYEWLRFLKDERYPVYEICNSKFEKVKEISRERALELIRNKRLTKVYNSKNGCIWR